MGFGSQRHPAQRLAWRCVLRTKFGYQPLTYPGVYASCSAIHGALSLPHPLCVHSSHLIFLDITRLLLALGLCPHSAFCLGTCPSPPLLLVPPLSCLTLTCQLYQSLVILWCHLLQKVPLPQPSQASPCVLEHFCSPPTPTPGLASLSSAPMLDWDPLVHSCTPPQPLLPRMAAPRGQCWVSFALFPVWLFPFLPSLCSDVTFLVRPSLDTDLKLQLPSSLSAVSW